MILDAAETVLGYFGFDRTVYGNKKNTGARKWRWLQELNQEREKDIRTEMSSSCRSQNLQFTCPRDKNTSGIR